MTIIDALLELQEVDGRVRELENELKDLPRRKAQETARLSGVSTDLKAALAGQVEAERRVTDYDDDAAAIQEQIRALKQQQMGLKTNKEYQDFSIRIELLEHKLEAAKNNSLAAMDYVGPAKDRIEAAQAKYDAEKSGVDMLCAELDERIAAVKAELEEARKERDVKAAAVTDPRFMLNYERLRTKRWPVVVALTHEGVCDGCHLVQPPSVGQMTDANVKIGLNGQKQEIVTCTMCGRILYRA